MCFAVVAVQQFAVFFCYSGGFCSTARFNFPSVLFGVHEDIIAFVSGSDSGISLYLQGSVDTLTIIITFLVKSI